jgi:hypothetical protein
MSDWVSKTVTIKVERYNIGPDKAPRYQLWLEDPSFPCPPACGKVEIQLPAGWEEMYFNDAHWGKSHDLMGRGCWLKQKETFGFEIPEGDHEYPVRYQLIESAG